MRSSTEKVLETLGGTRCPCGHLATRHKKADPNFRAGQLIEIRGACRDCDCRGEIAVDPKVLAAEAAAQCEHAGHEWKDAGGDLEVCMVCERERRTDDVR